MASGSKANYQQANKNTKAGVAALQPKNYSDPFGTLKNGVFNPTISADQQGALKNTGAGMNALTAQISKPFDVNSYYNNPFYDNTAALLKAPIDRQYQQDQLALQNNLNARNQGGSSFDAYSNNLLNQQHDYNTNIANLQARTASADAYNQSYNNNVSGLGALGQSSAQQYANIYQPMNAATGYQGAISGLQQGMGQLYGNMAQAYTQKKTPLDNLLSYYASNAAIVGGAAKAAAGGA